MHWPKSDDDTFADELPAGIAVQYRILRKLLPGRWRECQEAVGAMDARGRELVSTRSIGSKDANQFASSGPVQVEMASLASSSSCFGGNAWHENNKLKTLREIELGGPILDQLLAIHAAHSRLRAALDESWREKWHTFVEFESMQRQSIETMAGWFFETFSVLLLGRVFGQLVDQAQRATVAERRVRELERNAEELWKYNKILEESHGEALRTRPLEKDEMRREAEEVRHTLEVRQEELREANRTIVALRRQLRQAETASREPLCALMGEFEELKSQYQELVAAHGGTQACIEAKIDSRETVDEEEGGGGASVTLLRRQLKELQHQLSLKDTTIGLLRRELCGLRDLARELGASQAKLQRSWNGD
ncbi:hypothetical protein MOQ_001808 [Trypanosoma cruzi marinkellei]|uniref:Uncharacterized protein n=1 Tax=Trypanosoma cruzi marinkellei TaxID=85056 RepID=K2PA70_TRYCR|nr:hypothetical protein MOQ_001808 [Trypanosoma cruzi marinkellei]